jgi:E3 ubiquitin-protein ligase RNF38/44
MYFRIPYYVFVLFCYFALFSLLLSKHINSIYTIYLLFACILLVKPILICSIHELSFRNNNQMPIPLIGNGNTDDGIYDYCTMHYEEETECSICIHKNNEPSITLKCSCLNFYHKECIDNWLHVNPSCPTCKTTVNKIIP